jgi:hypothetical protein
MLHIKKHLPNLQTADDVNQLFEQRPEIREAFDNISNDKKLRFQKSTLRRKLVGEHIPLEVINVLFPPYKGGKNRKVEGNFILLSNGLKHQIKEEIKRDIEDIPLEEWTPELSAEIADIITKYYPNVTTATHALGNMRLGLVNLGIADPDTMKNNPILKATLRPEITILHNAKHEENRVIRASEGLNIPPPFQKISDLKDRIKAFIEAPETGTVQTLADLMVTISSRPGEVETLKVGVAGGITGALKKRQRKRGQSNDEHYNIVSAVGEDLAIQFVEKWKSQPTKFKNDMVKQLPDYMAQFGMTAKDLRPIGAALALRAETMAGNADTIEKANELHRQALRHEKPRQRQAKAFYEIVKDPLSSLKASLNELSPEAIEAIRHMIIKERQIKDEQKE